MAATRTMSPPDPDLETPGVDVVLTAADVAVQRELLEPRVRTLLGALHRRFWKRRYDLLQQHPVPSDGSDVRQAGDSSWAVDDFDAPAELRGGPDFCSDSFRSWDARLEGFSSMRAVGTSSSSDAIDVVRSRGWDVTEPAVLVDGRAIPGSVFDVGMTMALRADELRDGHSSLWLCIPAIHSEAEARLWNDLLNVAEDRLGVSRGTVRTIVSVESAQSMRFLDAILYELRTHAAAVCVVDGSGIDEVEVKDAAARRGAMFAGTLSASPDMNSPA